MSDRRPPEQPYGFRPVPLDGGLDFLTPASYTREGGVAEGTDGSLLRTLNYEIVDRAGYKRIDGYTRHDGTATVDPDKVYIFYSGEGDNTNFSNLAAGDYICSWNDDDSVYVYTSSTGAALPFGTVINTYNNNGNDYVVYLSLDRSKEPGPLGAVRGIAGTAPTTMLGVSDPIKATDGSNDLLVDAGAIAEYTPEAIVEFLGGSEFLDGTHEKKQEFSSVICGAKYFRDALYAVVDLSLFTFENGLVQIYPGDILSLNNTGADVDFNILGHTAKVMAIELDSGTWGVDAAGRILMRVYTRERSGSTMSNLHAYGSFAPHVWSNSTPYRKNGDGTYTANILDLNYTITRSGVNVETDYAWMADVWRTYSEEQAIEELGDIRKAGWNVPDGDIAGWLVPFTSGAASSGFLNKIKRNVGTQETTYSALNTSTSIPGDPTTSTVGKATTVLTGLDHTGAYSWSLGPTGYRRWDGVTTGTVGTLSYTQLIDGTDTSYLASNISLFDVEGTGPKTSHSVGLFGFGGLGAIPANAIIEGITVKVTLASSAGFTTPANIHGLTLRACLVKTSSLDDADLFGAARTETRIGDFRELALNVPAGAVNPITKTDGNPTTFGSISDLWGNTFIDREEIIKPEFGVAIDYNINVKTAYTDNAVQFRIHKVQMEVQYSTPSVRYYFADGTNTNIMYADLIDYQISSGSFETRDAAGVLQLTTPVRVAGTSNNIKSGWTMYNKDPSGAGEVTMASISGNMEYNGFAASYQLEQAKTYYEFIAANFYNNPDYEGMYFVNGIDRARCFDGHYITATYAVPLTETDSEANDKPRHIAHHHGRLALGYSDGRVLFSALGDPENFDPVDGAFPVTTSDPITGLLPMKGSTLGIFCTNSIHSATGTDADNITTSVISASSGCIEYTLQDLGSFPVFCDANGITSLQQSATYGDFAGYRLSHRVTPFLVDRMFRSLGTKGHEATLSWEPVEPPGQTLPGVSGGAFTTGQGSAGIARTAVSRKKSQYLVWFDDGTCLCMSLVGPERDPQFTIRRYLANGGSSGLYIPDDVNVGGPYYMIPLAVCSDYTERGENRIFFSRNPYKNREAETQLILFNLWSWRMFELDRGWGFDGMKMNHHINVGHFYLGNPFENKTIRAIRLEVLGRNYCPLDVLIASDYFLADLTDDTEHPVVPMDVPYNVTAPTGISNDFVPQSTILNGPYGEGRSFSLAFKNRSGFNGEGLGYSGYPEPPFYLQLLHIHYSGGHQDA